MSRNKATAWITLENPNQHRIYTNGDVVRGHAHFQPFRSREITRSYSINFIAEVRTGFMVIRNNHGRYYENTCRLFAFTQTLAPDDVSAETTLSLPFEFVIPWTSLPHPSRDMLPPSPVFSTEPDAPLPPSFGLTTHNRMQGMQSYDQTVEYYLQPVGHPRDINYMNRFPIHFCPARTVQTIQPQLFQHRIPFSHSHRSLDPNAPVQNLKQRTASIFKSSEAKPAIHFSVNFTVPAATIIGFAIPIGLELRYDDEKSTAPMRPDVVMVGGRVELDGRTDYRIWTDSHYAIPLFGDFDGSIPEAELHRVILTRWGKQAKEGSGEEQNVVLPWYQSPAEKSSTGNDQIPNSRYGEGLHLNDVIQGIGLGGDIVPTFSSGTISRSYFLRIYMDLRVGEKKFKVEIASRELVVLPDIWRPFGTMPLIKHMAKVNPNSEESNSSSGGKLTSAPPNYEEIEQRRGAT